MPASLSEVCLRLIKRKRDDQASGWSRLLHARVSSRRPNWPSKIDSVRDLGLKAPANLRDACQRLIKRNRDRRPIEWSTISLEPVGFDGKGSLRIGVVSVDGRRLGDLFNDTSPSFRCEPGEHTISLHFRRRYRIAAFHGKAIVSLKIRLEPGASVELVCGVNRLMRRPPRDLWLGWTWLIGWVPAVLLALIAVRAFPAGIPVLAHSQVTGQPLRALLSAIARSEMTLSIFLVAAWGWIVSIMFALQSRRDIESIRREPGISYYLTRKPEFRKPTRRFKTPYEDDFA
jgi:hypothetical protein